MATVTRKVLVCDMCKASGADPERVAAFGPVKTHQLTIDGTTVELEACQRCWRQDFVSPTAWVIRMARTVKRKKRVDDGPTIVPFPGQPWYFTFHALIRMGERHLQPGEVVTAVERPETVYTGEEVGTEVRIRGDIKVAVNPTRRSILTCARRNEEMESVA